jgi:hypothetical protein
MQPSSILRIPPELRLLIYSHCSAFTLLQLAHTSSLFYAEVNSYPAIVRHAFGYCQGYSTPDPFYELYRIPDFTGEVIYGTLDTHTAATYMDPEKVYEWTNLSLLDIEKVPDEQEARLFQRLYGEDEEEEEHREGRRKVCEYCRNIVQEYWAEFWFDRWVPDWSVNCTCLTRPSPEAFQDLSPIEDEGEQ